MAGIGHNNGPSMDRGVSYRRHIWTKAREDLLPVMPLPIVKMRVKRAAEIGLDYKTYATVRATTGRDVVALLFSTNALRLFRDQLQLEEARRAKLAAIQKCERRAITIAPLRPDDIIENELDAIVAAPHLHAPLGIAGREIVVAKGHHPADAVLMVGDTSLERDWSAAGRLAGYLSAERYFGG